MWCIVAIRSNCIFTCNKYYISSVRLYASYKGGGGLHCFACIVHLMSSQYWVSLNASALSFWISPETSSIKWGYRISPTTPITFRKENLCKTYLLRILFNSIDADTEWEKCSVNLENSCGCVVACWLEFNFIARFGKLFFRVMPYFWTCVSNCFALYRCDCLLMQLKQKYSSHHFTFRVSYWSSEA